ncbi:hypothetical protein [Hydrogenophaga pseudoflava]|uniref:hypothetical protein n=1 Tax=Hydrogenophaga pseudoflava TaxID=47421 RepID=UPI0027E4EF36|nr:hypothetical protein [Hydrogenophaga pseudoflava]MDQ7745663.1 hypothetical protein [Hydrogenophaga pseudoflava]
MATGLASDKKTTTRAILYRRFTANPNPGQTLQQLMTAALKKFPKPGDRYEPLNAASSEIRCIASTQITSNCLCGYLTTFERGAAQPVIADDPGASKLALNALAPPKAKAGKPQEQFIPGVLFFAVFNNHVAVVQSMSMRATALETHLNWLLKSKTSLLPATTPFALSDEAQKATKAKIKKSHVRAISIGQPLMTTVVEDAPTAKAEAPQPSGRKSSQKKVTRFRPHGPMLDVLKTIFENEEDFAKLGLHDVYEGNLEVWVQIRYPKRIRSRPEDSVKLMDTLGLALRDIEGDQVSLELSDGNKVEGKELKISGSVEVAVLQHNLPDESKLYESMVNWLTTQIQNGTVDP